MISNICEEFQCPPDVAMRQDLALCRAISDMRRFSQVWEKMQHDKKSLTQAEWDYLEWADKFQDQDYDRSSR